MSKPVVVVVGVGPGVGRAVAVRFAKEGFDVGLVARRAESLEPVREAVVAAGARAHGVAADATDAKQAGEAFAELGRELGSAEVLVYNAGAFKMGGLLDITPEEFDDCWRANCAGGFLAVREVLPGMVERGRGTILFTGATAALRGSAKFACLAVGKFGLRALAQSMAREFGPKGVHVAHVVVDGMIDTPRVRAMVPDREPHTLLDPEAIAETYWQLHQQDRTAWTLELDVRPAVERF